MIHNIVDFGMSTIPNFLLFILVAMISQKEKSKIEFKKIKNIPILSIIFLSLIIKWVNFSFENIKIDKAINSYVQALSNNDKEKAKRYILDELSEYPLNFDLNLRFADLLLEEAIEKQGKKYFFDASSQLEYILILNPYYIPAYEKLETIYEHFGEKEILRELRKRERNHIKWQNKSPN